MYVYTLVFIIVCGLDAISCRMASYKRAPHHINARSVTHDSVVQDEGELPQKHERCAALAFRCYEPILSYMDSDGEFCGWKDMNTYNALPEVCAGIKSFSLIKWGDNVLKYNYKFLKACDKTKEFQKCVRNNEVCSREEAMSSIISAQNIFCNSIQVWLPVITCMNAWDSSVGWNKLVYTDWRIVQACPATHYQQLTLNSIKLFLFTYSTYPSSMTDGVVESVNAEAAGRLICQFIQQDLCLWKRGDTVCNGYLPLLASQLYYDKQLINLCRTFANNNYGICNAFVKGNCLLNLTNGHMLVKMNFPDITDVYNMTYWHFVGNKEVDTLLHTENKGIGHCDVRNLIFKQLGCFHQYMTQMDINHANHGNYLSEYMCGNIKIYNSCFEAYIQSPCPEETEQFQGIGNLLHSQCDILKEANKNRNCPLFAVYSDFLFGEKTWFGLIRDLSRQYITVIIKYKQMNPAPSQWRDVLLYTADLFVTYYKSKLTTGEKLSTAVYYHNDIISNVCDQEAANVYNDFVILSNGEQYYQFLNHVIKGHQYIKYIVQQSA